MVRYAALQHDRVQFVFRSALERLQLFEAGREIALAERAENALLAGKKKGIANVEEDCLQPIGHIR